MAKLIFSNNASAVLASGRSSSATTLTVATGTGSRFKTPNTGEYGKLTLIDAATGGVNEIIHYTALSGDTFTIERGKEGTTAKTWLAGDIVASMLTAETLHESFKRLELAVSVKDFGAVGDGVADDTNAIQTALNQTEEGATLVFPAGAYKFSNVETTKSIRLVGTGFTNSIQDIFGASAWNDKTKYSGTVLMPTSTASTCFSMGDLSKNKCFQLENFMMVCAGAGTATGIELIRSVGTYVKNVLVCNAYKGWNIYNVQDSTFNKPACKGCKTGMEFGGTITSNQNVLINPEIQSYDTYGINNQSIAMLMIYGGVFQDGRSNAIGVYHGSACSYNKLDGCWFESNSATSYAVYDLGTNNKIEDCYFSTVGDRIYVGASSVATQLINNKYDPSMGADAVYIAAGATDTYIFDTSTTLAARFQDFGTNTIYESIRNGNFYQKIGMRSTTGSDTIGGIIGDPASSTRKMYRLTNIQNGTFYEVLNLNIPNNTHSAILQLNFIGVLGDNSAAHACSFNVAINRITNSGTRTSSVVYGSTQATSGSNTATLTIDVSLISGTPSSTQSLAIRATITRSGGTANNHYLSCEANLNNINASGITLS